MPMPLTAINDSAGRNDGDNDSDCDGDTSCDSSRSYLLYRNPLLRAEARLERGRVKVNVAGPLAHLPLIKTSMEMFEGQVAIQAGPQHLSLSTWIPPLPGRAFDRLANSRHACLAGAAHTRPGHNLHHRGVPNRCAHCALPNSGNRLHLSPACG